MTKLEKGMKGTPMFEELRGNQVWFVYTSASWCSYSTVLSPNSWMTFSILTSISWNEESSRYFAIWSLRSTSFVTLDCAATWSISGQQFVKKDVKLGGKAERISSASRLSFISSVCESWENPGDKVSGMSWGVETPEASHIHPSLSLCEAPSKGINSDWEDIAESNSTHGKALGFALSDFPFKIFMKFSIS